MTTTLSRWTVAIVVALTILVGTTLALRAAVVDATPRPPAPPVNQIEGGGGRIMFS